MVILNGLTAVSVQKAISTLISSLTVTTLQLSESLELLEDANKSINSDRAIIIRQFLVYTAVATSVSHEMPFRLLALSLLLHLCG